MKLFIAIILGRLANFMSKLLKHEGSVIGGYYALLVDKNLLKKIKFPKYVIGITGSSGKSSTTELTAHILKKCGLSVAYNKSGSNTLNGITSLIIENSKLNGTFNKDVLLMELDEKHMKELFKYFDLTHLVITNITRDQPPRNAHPEFIFEEIKKAFKNNCTLILNADDPFVKKYSIDHKGKIITYGMSKTNYSEKSILNNIDGAYCPKCKNKLNYSFYHYGHIGNYSCSKCDFKRGKLDYEAKKVNIKDRIMFINNDKITLPSSFLYSAYFTLAAYTITSELGLSKEKILYALNIDTIKTKRLNIYTLEKRKWQMLASKNENNLSYKQSLDFINKEPGIKTVVLGFENSSRRYTENDISWIWDIDFEQLKNKNIDKIVIIGRFKHDLLVRMTYAGINKNKIILVEDLNNIIDILKTKTKGSIYSMVCFDMEIILKGLLKDETDKN